MKNEQNQTLENINIHDVISVNKMQRTGEDGKKLGYGFYAKGELGVVTEISADLIRYIRPDLEEETYVPSEIDKDYYFSISKGSEIEYRKNIDKEGEKQQRIRDESQEKIMRLKEWKNDFESSISILGRMARFIKAFK